MGRALRQCTSCSEGGKSSAAGLLRLAQGQVQEGTADLEAVIAGAGPWMLCAYLAQGALAEYELLIGQAAQAYERLSRDRYQSSRSREQRSGWRCSRCWPGRSRSWVTSLGQRRYWPKLWTVPLPGSFVGYRSIRSGWELWSRSGSTNTRKLLCAKPTIDILITVGAFSPDVAALLLLRASPLPMTVIGGHLDTTGHRRSRRATH